MEKLLVIFANALKDLEITNAWIVNSEDGLDEISPYAITNICQLKNGEISNILIDPAELRIKTKGFDDYVFCCCWIWYFCGISCCD